MTEILVCVDAPHYAAAIVCKDGVCTEAANIMKWCVGKTWVELRRYFDRKGFKVEVMEIAP